MNILLKLIVSSKTMIILLFIFAIAMGLGTFIENDYGAIAAKNLIYEAWWFEFIMIFLIFNFIYNIKRYKLFKKEKIPVLIFHLSFILIFIGGAFSRYIGFEGTMHIREGQYSNEIITNKCFFQFKIKNYTNPKIFYDINYQFSPLTKKFTKKYNYENKKIEFTLIDYIPRAKDSIKINNNKNKIIEIIAIEKNTLKSYFLNKQTHLYLNKNVIGYNILNDKFKGINLIENKNGDFFIKSDKKGNYNILKFKKKGKIVPNLLYKFHFKTLYSFGNTHFLIVQLPKKGTIIHYEGDKEEDKSNLDLIIMKVKSDNISKIIKFNGGKTNTNIEINEKINGIIMNIKYGPKIIKTPFNIKLNNFQIKRYPGSNFPSSYASEITLIDPINNNNFNYKIFMNNILNYKGFRFFQSSFDVDEKGTILSVNHDFIGTITTYIGYFFLFLGMFLTFFWRGTRFWNIHQKLISINMSKNIMTCFLLIMSYLISAYSIQNNKTILNKFNNLSYHPNNIISPNKIIEKYRFNKKHIEKFGEILVQDFQGRIIPTNTLALNILKKLTKKNNFYGMKANEWFLAISMDPLSWIRAPIIKIGNKASPALLKKINADIHYNTSLINLFPINNFSKPYFILHHEFKKAFLKKVSDRNNDDNEIILINEKAIIIQNLISNVYMKFIPIKNHPNNLWTSWINENFKINKDAKNLIIPYLKSVYQANYTNNWKECNKNLIKISNYQKIWGKGVIPKKIKIKAEIFYNKINIFYHLMIIYSIIGILLTILSFTEVLNKKSINLKFIKYIINFILFLLLITTIIHFLGLILRWYIAEHPPWTNGYEAIIFISWIGVLSGFLLYKNRNTFIPTSGCLIAIMMLSFAHGGADLNPQITPLVPVLKSYWLLIHVAIITSSYGLFGLSALIGFIVLCIFIISNGSNSTKNTIKELSIVNELSMHIALFLLTIGTFLGAIWANESWGRYWSWDPKETWAFISIIIYTIVLHSHLIPKLKGCFAFNFMSLISFSSIIMTYFGVNYYLSGLHSYAAGDPIPIPNWVYYTIFIIIILSTTSYISFLNNFNKNVES